MKRLLAVSAVAVSLLAACGQTTPDASNASAGGGPLVRDYLHRPELRDASSQAVLAQYGNHPGLLAALQEAYSPQPQAALSWPQVRLGAQDLASERLTYIKRTGWGTVAHYDSQYAAYTGTALPYAGLNWTRDGCSAPEGVGLGYREDFRPACNVHDFAYRNLKVYERTDANRKTSDEVFYTNMKAICAAKSWYARPACYSAAFAYYEGVRVGGGSSF